MRIIKILSVNTFTDFCEFSPLSNAATDDINQLENFQVDFNLEVDGIAFLVIFQSLERRNGMMAYNGYEVTPGGHYGCDADQYHELQEYLGEDTDECQSFLAELKAIATKLSKDELEQRTD